MNNQLFLDREIIQLDSEGFCPYCGSYELLCEVYLRPYGGQDFVTAACKSCCYAIE